MSLVVGGLAPGSRALQRAIQSLDGGGSGLWGGQSKKVPFSPDGVTRGLSWGEIWEYRLFNRFRQKRQCRPLHHLPADSNGTTKWIEQRCKSRWPG